MPARQSAAAVTQLFMQGVALHQQGQTGLARAIYQQVLAQQAHHPDALHLLGVIELQQDNAARAVQLITQALEGKPNDAGFHCNLGLALAALGRHTEALASYERAIALRPRFAEALFNRANQLTRLQRHAQAIEGFQQALAIRPDHATTHYNLGVAYAQTQQHDQAAACFERALALRPQYPEAWSNLGNAWQALSQHERALACYDKALAMAPGYVHAWSNRGNALLHLGQPTQALASFDQALAIDPACADAHYNRGNVLLQLDRAPEALDAFDTATQFNRQFAAAYLNHGVALVEMNRCVEGLQKIHQALEIEPDNLQAYIHQSNALFLLKEDRQALASLDAVLARSPGNPDAEFRKSLYDLATQSFTQGWARYGQRKAISEPPRIDGVPGLPWWSEGPPSGPVLIVGEQGIGDEVFFSKSLGLYVQRHGAPAGVAVDPRLLPIFERSFPQLRFVSRADLGTLDPSPYRQQMTLGDMVAWLAVDPRVQVEVQRPHLQARLPSAAHAVRHPTGQRRPRIGLSWRSKNAKFGADKSMSLMQMMRAFQGLDVEWLNLQYGDVGDELAEVASALGTPVHAVEGLDVFHDLDGLLQVIADCDAVVTTSNSTAHFAGALGKPGLVLVHAGWGKLWYWHAGDGPSVWYPSLHVCHAQQPGEWGPVLGHARHWLEQRAWLPVGPV